MHSQSMLLGNRWFQAWFSVIVIVMLILLILILVVIMIGDA